MIHILSCERLSLSTLKVYVAAIAVNHSLEAGRTIGRIDLVIKFLRGARRLNPPRPKGAFTPDANEALSASDLHVKSMQRRE